MQRPSFRKSPASPSVLAVIACLISFAGTAVANAEIKVTASIKPVHSLVAAIMGDSGKPDLLIKGAASPHGFSMQPSQARQLQSADVVFWIGHNLEGFLEKPLESIADKAVSVELGEAPGIHEIKLGEKHEEEGHGHKAEAHDEGHEGHDHGSTDPHVWLDPINAIAMSKQIAATLSKADPDNADIYKANAERLIADLDQLHVKLKTKIAPVQKRNFIVFHDAFPHLQHRYGLTVADSFVVDPERQISAAKLTKIRKVISEKNVGCIFSEPQFNPKSIDVAIEGTKVKTAEVDVLGAGLETGPKLYFNLMENLGDTLVKCLSS